MVKIKKRINTNPHIHVALRAFPKSVYIHYLIWGSVTCQTLRKSRKLAVSNAVCYYFPATPQPQYTELYLSLTHLHIQSLPAFLT